MDHNNYFKGLLGYICGKVWLHRKNIIFQDYNSNVHVVVMVVLREFKEVSIGNVNNKQRSIKIAKINSTYPLYFDGACQATMGVLWNWNDLNDVRET